MVAWNAQLNRAVITYVEDEELRDLNDQNGNDLWDSGEEAWGEIGDPDTIDKFGEHSGGFTTSPIKTNTDNDGFKDQLTTDYYEIERGFGKEYLNWPYYRPKDHDSQFRSEGDELFSHTYMERFWPPIIKGIIGVDDLPVSYPIF